MQTEHMRNRVVEYANNRNLTPKKVHILAPLPRIEENVERAAKQFNFQYFYPATRFEHKRTGLAIASMNRAAKLDRDLGLLITLPRSGSDSGKAVCYSGEITHQAAMQLFASSDALLFTSVEESLGLPLLEALHFELPAVLPNLEYAREIYGDAAIYYNINYEEELVQAIQTLKINYARYKILAKQRKQTEWANRKSWREHWSQFINDIEQSYQINVMN